MARPSYLDKNGIVSLSPEEWNTLEGDGTPDNPITVMLKGSNKRIKITGTIDASSKAGKQYDNLVNGVMVKNAKTPQGPTLESIQLAATQATTATTVTGPTGQTAFDKFGIGEALLNDKKYGAQLRKVFELWKAGKLTEAQEEYFKTDWAKLDDDVRERYLLNLEKQDVYKERLREFGIRLKGLLNPRGLKITDEKIKDYFDRGIDEDVIIDELTSGITATGAAGASANALDDLRTTARNNGFNLDKDFAGQVDDWLRRIARGEDIEDFKRLIRAQAKLGLPEKVGTLLDEGLDLANVFQPYRSQMAALLEVTPDAISLDDPLLRSAYGPDKETSLYDFKRAVRKDPRWQYTDNAREDVSNVALQVLRDFGFQG
jgi:hypothetical protein